MKNVGKILAALLALAVLLSFSSVIAFAEEADDSAASTEAVSDESKDEASSDETSAETKADDESKKDTTTSTTEKKDDEEEDHFVLYTGLITLAIILVIAICVVVWILKDKERALKTWRSFKSEFKKIVWAEKHETLKKTIIVVVALVVFGAVIGLLDYLFSFAIVSLGKLI